jgi:hypothetical protein
MSESTTGNTSETGANSFLNKRRHDATPLLFKQLDPLSIVDGVLTNTGYLAHDFVVAGEIRETCPECKTTHLKLVLLQVGVIKAHLVCTTCTRCFDVFYPDGSSALEIPNFY